MRQSAQEREFSNTARQQERGETERQIYALSKREQFKLIQWGTHTVVLFENVYFYCMCSINRKILTMPRLQAVYTFELR